MWVAFLNSYDAAKSEYLMQGYDAQQPIRKGGGVRQFFKLDLQYLTRRYILGGTTSLLQQKGYRLYYRYVLPR